MNKSIAGASRYIDQSKSDIIFAYREDLAKGVPIDGVISGWAFISDKDIARNTYDFETDPACMIFLEKIIGMAPDFHRIAAVDGPCSFKYDSDKCIFVQVDE